MNHPLYKCDHCGRESEALSGCGVGLCNDCYCDPNVPFNAPAHIECYMCDERAVNEEGLCEACQIWVDEFESEMH